MRRAVELLTQLLAVTPPPPAGGEVEALIASFTAMAATRDQLFATLAAVLDGAPLAESERDLARELAARQRAWWDALAAARERLCEQRLGVGKLRVYAAVEGAELEPR